MEGAGFPFISTAIITSSTALYTAINFTGECITTAIQKSSHFTNYFSRMSIACYKDYLCRDHVLSRNRLMIFGYGNKCWITSFYLN